MQGEDSELRQFGYWASAKSLGHLWVLEQIQTVLQRCGTIELPFSVAERVAEAARSEPLRALRCLSLALNQPASYFELHEWTRFAEQILSFGLQSQLPEAAHEANQVINKLAAMGEIQFRSLLAGPRSPPV